MKKEVMIAIAIGFILGLVIVYGFYQMRKSARDKATPTTDLEEVVSTSPTPEPSPVHVINILTPEDGVVQKERYTVVSGTTIPNAYTVLFVNERQFVSTSDVDGNFSFEVSLEAGSNVLITHVVNESGETSTAERVVIVSEALDNIDSFQQASPSAEEESTSEEAE